jgi:hypothetical protein
MHKKNMNTFVLILSNHERIRGVRQPAGLVGTPSGYGIRAPLKIHISSRLPCCRKNLLLTYQPDAALRGGVSRQSAQRMLAKFFFALLTTPHGPLLPVADRRPLVGHLGEL